MEGGMATTPICNPHICRVLFGTVRYFGVQWGDVGYWDLLGYTGGRGYRGVLWLLQGTGGYCGVLLGNRGTLGYCVFCGLISGTTQH